MHLSARSSFSESACRSCRHAGTLDRNGKRTMSVGTTVPEQLLTVVAATTIFTVMFAFGLEIALGEFRSVVGSPYVIWRRRNAGCTRNPSMMHS